MRIQPSMQFIEQAVRANHCLVTRGTHMRARERMEDDPLSAINAFCVVGRIASYQPREISQHLKHTVNSEHVDQTYKSYLHSKSLPTLEQPEDIKRLTIKVGLIINYLQLNSYDPTKLNQPQDETDHEPECTGVSGSGHILQESR